MRDGLSAVRAEIGAELTGLRAEMAEQGSSLATQMRVLHEDVISRFALLQEGLTGPPGADRGRVDRRHRTSDPGVPRGAGHHFSRFKEGRPIGNGSISWATRSSGPACDGRRHRRLRLLTSATLHSVLDL